jgi:hypothetical protein
MKIIVTVNAIENDAIKIVLIGLLFFSDFNLTVANIQLLLYITIYYKKLSTYNEIEIKRS